MVIMSMILVIPTYASVKRSIDIYPQLKFNGTKATCTITITGERMTDRISATMTLQQGNTLINSWTGSGFGILKLDKTTGVAKNKTYTLTITYSINGVKQKPVSVSRSNR